MQQSNLFQFEANQLLEAWILELLNNEPYFLSEATASSPRAAGDAIQSILSTRLVDLLDSSIQGYSATFARRAMADFAFSDADGFYYSVDVKTHRLDTAFNMPNLVSVQRLTDYYDDEHKYFVLLLVDYSLLPNRVNFHQVHFLPIEHLSWSCLTIGALGTGQIQIANANKLVFERGQSRRQWMLQLCERMLTFYPNEIRKIGTRIAYFEKAKERWEAREA
jgi:hypothetical protein